MSAALLGARDVVMTDGEPTVLECAKFNLEKNRFRCVGVFGDDSFLLCVKSTVSVSIHACLFVCVRCVYM
jgi:hypothetical protein